MASTLNKTLPGYGPIKKVRLTFTDSVVDGTADATLTIAEIQHGLVSMTPDAARVITLPSALDMVNANLEMAGLAVSDTVPLIIRNQAALGSGFNITVAAGAGFAVDSEANLTITPQNHSEYNIRMDDVNPTAPAGTVFQVDAGSAAASGGSQLASVQEDPAGGGPSVTIFDGTAPFIAIGSDATGMGAPVALELAANGANLGITISAGLDGLDVPVGGSYQVDVSVAGTPNNSAAPYTLNVGVGLNGAAPATTAGICSLVSDTVDGISSGSGSILLDIASGDTINFFLSGAIGFGASEDFTTSLVQVTVHNV